MYIVSLFQVKKINTLFSDLICEQLCHVVIEPGRRVVFNLEGIRFIDTAGFRMLELARQKAEEQGALFQLCNVGEEVRELLAETDVSNSFDILPALHVQEKILMELDD